MKTIAILLLTLCAAGCATCQQHPVWCAVGAAVVVGSIAASVERHHDQHRGYDPCGPDAPNRASGVIGQCAKQGMQFPFVRPIGH